MKIAIVGTSMNLSEDEEREVRGMITNILKNCMQTTEIISGGAKGVDSIAIEIADLLGLKTHVYKPDGNNWEAFKERNLWISHDCDELYCISVPVHDKPCYHHDKLQQHEKTAGCWTLNKTKELGKPCQLLVAK